MRHVDSSRNFDPSRLGDNCREQLGEPCKEPFQKQQPFAPDWETSAENSSSKELFLKQQHATAICFRQPQEIVVKQQPQTAAGGLGDKCGDLLGNPSRNLFRRQKPFCPEEPQVTNLHVGLRRCSSGTSIGWIVHPLVYLQISSQQKVKHRFAALAHSVASEALWKNALEKRLVDNRTCSFDPLNLLEFHKCPRHHVLYRRRCWIVHPLCTSLADQMQLVIYTQKIRKAGIVQISRNCCGMDNLIELAQI